MIRSAAVLTILLMSGIYCVAQPKERFIGVYSSVVNGGALMQTALIGGSFSVDETHSLRFGITYGKQLGSKLFFHTGAEYAHHKLSISYYPDNPNTPQPPSDPGVLDLLSIPLTIHASWKLLYFNAGLMADIQLKNVLYNQGGDKAAMPNQTGLGPLVEVGFNYPIKRFVIYSGLVSTVHCIIPFSSQKSKMYYNEADVRVGLRYEL